MVAVEFTTSRGVPENALNSGRWVRQVWLVLLLGLALGCAAQVDNSQVHLPTPVQSTTLGPGDLFRLEIVGEKALPKEYQVASDGTVDFPYVGRFQVSGLEPQQVAAQVRQGLVEGDILTDPSVVVAVSEYKSKRVAVLGEVKKSGSFPLLTGMTLVQIISQAGGLTPLANPDRVTLTRVDGLGSTTVSLSLNAITDGRAPDVPLQAGDRIFIKQRVF